MRSLPETKPLVAFLVLILIIWAGLYAFIRNDNGTETDVETKLVLALRDPADASRIVGPRWLEEAVRDITALGGYAVLMIVIVCFSLFIIRAHNRRQLRFFLTTVLCGFGAGMLLKAVFGRSRPGVVPHLSHVESASFPSAHSMMSAIVYLTVGLILAESVSNSRVRSLTVSVPLLLTLLVGISRIFMGVHYPSDVLAGWTAGIVWTMLAFHFNQFLISRGV